MLKDLAQIMSEVEQQDGRLWIKHSDVAGCLCFGMVSTQDRRRAVFRNVPSGEPGISNLGNGTFSLIVQDLAARYLEWQPPTTSPGGRGSG